MDAVTTRPAPFVRPDVQSFLDLVKQAGRPDICELPVAEGRQGYNAMKTIVEVDPLPLATIRDLACPGPAGAIPLRLYDARESRGPGPLVVFYHGGGFVIGDLESHHSLCTEIAAGLDLPVVSVDYRLAPEHKFPAAPDDCEAATRWVAESSEALGREVTGLIPMGDSAGGNLAIVTTLGLRARPAAAPVLLQVPIYPATDDAPSNRNSMVEFGEGFLLTRQAMQWFSEVYAADTSHFRGAPILADHALTPPTVLVTAGLDPLRDEGRAYAAELILAGSDVVYLERQGTIHGFANNRKVLPSAQGDVEAILAAVRLLLARITAPQ